MDFKHQEVLNELQNREKHNDNVKQVNIFEYPKSRIQQRIQFGGRITKNVPGAKESISIIKHIQKCFCQTIAWLFFHYNIDCLSYLKLFFAPKQFFYYQRWKNAFHKKDAQQTFNGTVITDNGHTLEKIGNFLIGSYIKMHQLCPISITHKFSLTLPNNKIN